MTELAHTHRPAVQRTGGNRAGAAARPIQNAEGVQARFGHGLDQFRRAGESAGAVQRAGEEDELQMKAASIQRAGEEDELQMKADPSIQRAPEDEELQMQADPSIQRLGEEDELQMKAAVQREANGVPSYPDPPVASGGGAALPSEVQAKMEGSFGTSFSDVRVHQGSEAASIGAIAYTRGSDIHFQPGAYDPGSPSGQQLLGHELTHVVQQRAGRVDAPQAMGAPINADPGLEAEADVMGARAAAGLPAAGPQSEL